LQVLSAEQRIMTVLRCWQAGLGAAALIALHTSGSALAGPLSTGSDSIKILFSGGVDPATGLLKGSPSLTATFPDLQAGTFIMDTGSAGMVVYKAGFSPPAGASPAYKDVIQAYKSDNLLFEGDVYTTQIEIGTPGNSVTSTVPILYATKQRCADESQTAVQYQPDQWPTGQCQPGLDHGQRRDHRGPDRRQHPGLRSSGPPGPNP
jgi:hypothetical protein